MNFFPAGREKMRKFLLKVMFGIITILVLVVVVSLFLFRDHAGDMYKQALELRNDGKNEEAADMFGLVATLYPESKYADDAIFEEGFTYYVVKVPKTEGMEKGVLVRLAEDAFEQLIDKYPESQLIEKARMYLGEIYTAMGDDAKALKHYEAAEKIVTDPKKLQEIYHYLAGSYERLNLTDKAIEKLRKIIEIGIPGRFYEDAYLTLVRYYRVAAEVNDEKAGEYYKIVVDLIYNLLDSGNEISESTRNESLLALVHSLLELKRYDEAEVALDQLPKHPASSANRALIDDYRDRIKRHSMMGK